MNTVLYMSAPWCAPCRVFGPLLASVIHDYDNITLESVNVDMLEGQKKALPYNIKSVPVLISSRKDVQPLNGGVEEAVLRAWLTAANRKDNE